MVELVDPELLGLLACPKTGQTLYVQGPSLVSEDRAHTYPVVEGIPYLLNPSAPGEHHVVLESNRRYLTGAELSADRAQEYLQDMLAPTCGNLFQNVAITSDESLPIPRLRAFSDPGYLLDVGCNWGRWTIGAARAGYRPIGCDIHLEGLLVAKRLAERTGVKTWFVAADARYLPFKRGVFAAVLSYGVLQHVSKEDARSALNSIRRVLATDGKSRIQMANRAGLRSAMNILRQRSREPRRYDIRYYGIAEMLRLFNSAVGRSTWEVDCFLGLNVHGADRELVQGVSRLIIDVAEALRALSGRFAPFARLADSVWVESIRS